MLRKKIKFYVLKNEILKWLKNLKEVFKIISERELSSSYVEINYEIILKTETIKSSSFISIKSKKQEIIKEYLDEMMKKK